MISLIKKLNFIINKKIKIIYSKPILTEKTDILEEYLKKAIIYFIIDILVKYRCREKIV